MKREKGRVTIVTVPAGVTKVKAELDNEFAATWCTPANNIEMARTRAIRDFKEGNYIFEINTNCVLSNL